MNYNAWCDLLPVDDIDRDFILNGIFYGFHITDIAEGECVEPVDVDNHRSCKQFCILVEKQIVHELDCNNFVVTQEKHVILVL